MDPESREAIRAAIARLADIPDELLESEPNDDGPDCGA